jgi:hypothetical protein
MLGQVFSRKYQALEGTSYSSSMVSPVFMPPSSPSMLVRRERKWYGGPGRRATLRVLSKTSYILPKALDGRAQAQAMRLA